MSGVKQPMTEIFIEVNTNIIVSGSQTACLYWQTDKIEINIVQSRG